MKKILILILLMSGCFILESYAQKVTLKSNLLYDATATMNLGLEFGLARLVFCEWEYAAKPLSGTSVWCGILGRAFVDIEKTLEY